ncbi:MAG: hypothetical protein DHS20C11_26060 [Lysobacteraceae bacterium]|nr:MAG: hypothetical protein DHS20C11_26060 [Xanthomonadaceae bacterium]
MSRYCSCIRSLLLLGVVLSMSAPQASETPQATSLLGQPLYAAPADQATLNKQAYALIWYGRRTAYTGDYQGAIEIFSAGVDKFPNDARMYRHRGHRYISTRQFELAIADLEHAVSLIEGSENQIEPDGLPNAQGIPVSTLHGNIWYHLGLAYYLKHDWENARRAYQMGYDISTNDDNRVSTAHWLYMIHRRMGDKAGAERAVAEITTDMNVIENHAYHRLCLFYKGVLAMDEVAEDDADNPGNAAIAYGLANWANYSADQAEATARLNALLATDSWAAFGYIAAEADVAAEF